MGSEVSGAVSLGDGVPVPTTMADPVPVDVPVQMAPAAVATERPQRRRQPPSWLKDFDTGREEM